MFKIFERVKRNNFEIDIFENLYYFKHILPIISTWESNEYRYLFVKTLNWLLMGQFVVIGIPLRIIEPCSKFESKLYIWKIEIIKNKAKTNNSTIDYSKSNWSLVEGICFEIHWRKFGLENSIRLVRHLSSFC